MIQRIQSVYLLISALCLSLMLKFPFANFSENAEFNAYGVELSNTSDTITQLYSFPSMYMIIGLLTLLLLIIVLYKKRKLQMVLCRLSYLLILAMIVVLYFNIEKINESLSAQVAYGVGLYLPVAALAFNFLANRAIKKDEQLVKSLDRLR